MAKLLKNIFFTTLSINNLSDAIQKFYPDFDKKKFVNLMFDDDFDNKELKEKMHHTTLCLHKTLPKSLKETLDILIKTAPYIKGFDALTLPDYVELYGLDDLDLSLSALAFFTKHSTSEFAIRPFILKYPETVMAFMKVLAEDKDHNVRRFASEGCRPRLPWAMALPEFKKNPTPILPILEKLKNDESEFVRRSVANNLNDISKDHPDLVLEICEKWYGHSKNTNKIVKHACRGMLKAGNRRALKLFGFSDSKNLKIENLKLNKETICIGENLNFSFDLIIDQKRGDKVRLEYAVYFKKSNRKSAKKIFQITENTYAYGKYKFSKKHSFKDLSTRKHYAGTHKISIIINGLEAVKISFVLKKCLYE